MRAYFFRGLLSEFYSTESVDITLTPKADLSSTGALHLGQSPDTLNTNN